jgi:hypothetical protein
LSSEHSVASPSEVCTSVVPCDSSESGKTPDKRARHPMVTKVETVLNKLHYYMAVSYSDTKSKENELCHRSSDKVQDIGFTATNTNTLI